MNSYRWPRLLIVGLLALLPVPLLAATAASDVASDPAYDGGWLDGAGGGTGWGSTWSLAATTNDLAQAGFIIGSATNNNGGVVGGTDIDTAGESWGMYANNGNEATATRSFNGVMELGQTLGVDLDSGAITNLPGSEVGVELLNEAGAVRFRCYATGADANYLIDDGDGAAFDSGVPVTNAGVRIAFRLTGSDNYEVTITTDAASQAYARLLAGAAGSLLNRVRLFNRDGGAVFQASDAYFNSLALDCVDVPACDIAVTAGNACANGNLTFEGPSGLDAYEWSLAVVSGDAALVPPLTNSTVEVFNGTGAGEYTLTLTNVLGGCTNSCATNIVVTATPACAITVTPACGSTELCAPGGLSAYAWTGPGIVGALDTQCVTVNSNGTYQVSLQDADGCQSSCSTNVTVLVSPFCVDPAGVGFPHTKAGETSDPIAVTISNCSDRTVSITGVALGGPDAGAFVLGTEDCAGNSLAPGDACTVEVSFAPSVTGPLAASLLVTHADCFSPLTIPLDGAGYDAQFVVSPSVLSFGDQVVAVGSVPLTVVVENVGTQILAIASAVITGANSNEFSVFANDCAGGPVAPGDACGIRVQFTPTVLGLRTAILEVAANDGNPPQEVVLLGSGVIRQPDLTATPDPLVFPEQPVTTTSAVTSVTLRNTGSASLVITNILLAAGHTNDFVLESSPCNGATLSSNETCEVGLRFKPTQTGLRAVRLDVFSTAGALAVDVTGTGVPPLSVDPTSLDFGGVVVGATSIVQSITVSNDGAIDQVISSVSSFGGDAGDYLVTGTCVGTPVPAGGTCQIDVRFAPGAAGVRSSTIRVISNAGADTNTVAVTGTGLVPAIALTPSTLTFPTQLVATVGAPLAVTVENVGASPLTIASLALVGAHSNDFAIAGETCDGATLAPGAICEVNLTFTPTAGGLRTAALRVNSNATNPPPVEVALQGVGDGGTPLLGVDPDSLAFGDGVLGIPTASQFITVTNAGNGVLVISEIQPVGGAAADFLVGGSCLGTPVPPLGSCQIEVQLQATAVGLRSSTIRILSNAGTGTNNVPVSGTGIAPVLFLTPTAVNFSTQEVGVASAPVNVAVLNNGDGPLVIDDALAITGPNAGDFSVAGDCTGSTLQPGEGCTLVVRFTPGALGARTAVLAVSGGATNSPQNVALSGVGAVGVPSIGYDPESVDFGNWPLGATSGVQAVTFENTGGASLLITNLVIAGTHGSNFLLVSGDCLNNPIGPGETCTVNLRFTPTALGVRVGELRVFDNAGGSPHVVPLTGSARPVLVLASASLDFGGWVLGTTSTVQSVTVSNTGVADLVISDVSAVGGAAGDYLAGGTCVGAPIPPGGTCQVDVRFAPGVGGVRASTIELLSNAGTGTDAIAVTGTGLAPALTLTPSALTFPTQLVTTVSAPQVVTLENVGDAPVTIASLALVGAQSNDFAIAGTTCAGATLAPGATCTVSLTFGPKAGGLRTAALRVSSNATNPPPVEVALQGVGDPGIPSLETDPDSLAFGDGVVGIPTAAQFITVTNAGNGALIISDIQPVGGAAADFLVSGSCVGATVPPFGSCQIQVRFQAGATGPRSSTIRILSNAASSPNNVPVSGTGIAPRLFVTPLALDFGTQEVGVASAGINVAVLNTGDAPLAIDNVLAITGANAGDYSVAGNCLGDTLLPGEGCTVIVRFTPGALGTRTAVLAITGAAVNSPQNVTLTGVGGVGVPSVGFTPTELNFGNQKVGTTSIVQSVTIRNTGGAALLITNLVVGGVNGGDFLVVSSTCLNNPIASGGTCTVNLRFVPGDIGERLGALLVFDNAGGSPHSVPLRGTGVAPSAAVDPLALDFGSVQVGTNSATQVVTVTNDGVLPLVLGGVQIAGPNAGDFAVTQATCSNQTLAAGQSCTITLRFQPLAIGTRTASLEIESDALDSPHTVSLTGVGLTPVPVVCLSPLALSFQASPGQTSAVRQVTVENCGLANLVISDVQVQGAGAGDFVVVDDGCNGETILPGDTCTISVVYVGPAGGGGSSAELAIASNASGSPHTVSLVGAECALTITPALWFSGVAGEPYAGTTLVAVGATPPVTWSIIGGALPDGMGLTASGTATGTPTQVGTFVFVVQAIDSRGCVGVQECTLSISCSRLTIIPTTLPSAGVGVPYSYLFNAPVYVMAQNGSAPYTFIRIAGALPPGLVLDNDGLISGTATAAGIYSFTVQAYDTAGCNARRNYTIVAGCPQLAFTPTSLTVGEVGQPYPVTAITATGGAGGYTYAVTGGSLPASMSLSEAGLLSGTPTSPGSSFTITATDVNGCQGSITYVLYLAIPPPSLVTPALPAALVGASYSQNIEVDGGAAPLQFAVIDGALPTGVSLSAAGVLSGTPSGTGTAAFTVQVKDAQNRTATRAYALSVTDAGGGSLSLSPSTLPDGTVGAAYAATITASGGTGAVTYERISGALPPGLELAAATGQLTGAPSTVGTYTFTVRATDEADATGSRAYAISVTTAGTSAVEFISPTCLATRTVTTAQLRLRRAGTATGPAQVRFATQNGSAVAGVDYTMTTGTVAFAAGQSAATISVPLLGNPAQDARSFTVGLSDPSGCLLGSLTVVTVTLTDRIGVVDTDGELLSVALKGDGTLMVELGRAGGNLIERVTVTGATSKSQLAIKLKKSKTGDALCRVGSIVIDQEIKSIQAKNCEFAGDGLRVQGYVRSMNLYGLANGADLVSGGNPAQRTKLKMKTQGPGSEIVTGSTLYWKPGK